MKEKHLKALGFAFAGGLALLFAGCTQQANTGGGGTGGQEPPKPIQVSFANLASGDVLGDPFGTAVTYVDLSYNEDAQVQEVALYVDDKLVGKQTITSSSVRSQFLTASFALNTLACAEDKLGNALDTGCSPSDNTPVFTNGSHTLKAVLKNAVETKSLTLPVVFDNDDAVLLTLSGNNAPDANNYVWYGGDDLTVTAVPVSYTGKPVSKVRLSGSGSGITSAGILASGTDLDLGAGANAAVEQTVSSGSATFTVQKSLNGNVQGGIRLDAQIRYTDGTLSDVSIKRYALDFRPPDFNDMRMELNGVFPSDLLGIAGVTGNWLNGNSPIYADVSDGPVPGIAAGVGGVTYQIKVTKASDGSTVATLNPNDTLNGLAEVAPGAPGYKLQVVNLRDALGNTAAALPVFPGAAGGFGLDKTAPSLTTTFGANGKVLNGTLVDLKKDIKLTLTEAATGSGLGGPDNISLALPDSSSSGAEGWYILIQKGGCTYNLSINGDLGLLPATSGAAAVRLPGSNGLLVGPVGCPFYAPPSPTGGDGDYTVTIRAVDQARNVSAPVTVNFYWLTQKPTLTFTSALPGSLNLGAADQFVLANGAVQVNSPKPLKAAVLYSAGPGAPSDVQYVASPLKNINNAAVGAPIFNTDGTVNPASLANYQDITASAASGLSFQLRFNTFGGPARNYNITVSAVPEAYDNAGNLDVSNLDNRTSQTVSVTVNP